MSKKLIIDISERAIWTFIQAAAGVIIVTQGFSVEVWKAAAVAGGLAVAKGVTAGQFGNDKSAAALPGSVDG